VTIDQFFAREATMWRMLKATLFWKALQQYLESATPIPVSSYVRMQLQTPHDMNPEELGRVFLEQDSVALMTTVCLNSSHVALAIVSELSALSQLLVGHLNVKLMS
jgi:hypothetical protein